MNRTSQSASAGELLPEALRLYLKCFWRLALVAALAELPPLLLKIATKSNGAPNRNYMLLILLATTGTSILCLAFQAGASFKILEAAKRDSPSQEPWLKACLAFGWNKFIALIGVKAIWLIAAVAMMLLAFSPSMLLPRSLITGPAFLILAGPVLLAALFLAVRFSLASCVCFFEGRKPIDCYARSYALSMGNFGNLFATCFAGALPGGLAWSAIFILRFAFPKLPLLVVPCLQLAARSLLLPLLACAIYIAYLRLASRETPTMQQDLQPISR